MGAWGIKALERDEGLDVLDILKNEYVPEHPVMDLGEMIELMKEEVMLGSDFSQIDFLFDNTAMALAELYFQWKDNGKLDYDHEEAIWDKVTGFTASKEALAFLLRQLTDIKNEVPDEDGIREIMDLWKNEDSGEIAPAWLEHLNQLIDRLDSEQEARQMYIKKYWGNFIGGSDDSLNLVAFLEDQKKEEIPLSEIFAKIGLDKQNWDFRQTVEYLEFTHSDGVEMDFHFAIDVVTDLAAILLECSVSGSVNLQDLDEYNTPIRRIRITATPEEHEAMDKALADFAQSPLTYDLHEMMDDEEIQEMAHHVEALRKELYEAAGRNRDYHVKAEDVKSLLPDWKGADGCIATNRITVEGRKVGYCYREIPDGNWDSGWRFTAGDESDEYMDDPNNAGIYKLNTICNDDPDIISLLNTPAPCAFERDENGVFQQIKDWKPDEDEEDPEAYLFIPFDEDYYQAMAEVIEERFTNWQGQDFDEDTLEPSEVAQAIMEYLDCECTYFPSMADDDPIMSAYSYARRLGVREGFVPVLIQADDETQLECLVMNADPEHDADFYEFDLKTVEEYRKKMLSAPIKDGKAILEELTGQRKEEAEDDDLDWDEEVLGEMEGGEPNDRFANYWNDDTGMTYPLILAKIPVKNPWEIFAYLPFGNWNECPDTPDLMAVAKYWFEQHGAIPAAMSHDELEFELPTPISKERAMEVAVEQYGFCPDLDQNEDGSIGSLADVLWQSTVWYFWWD